MTTANLTIQDNDTVIQYTAAPAQTIFPYDFPILDSSELAVSVDQVDQTLATNYTIDGIGDAGGGNVTFLSAMAGGEIVTLWLDMPLKRLTGFQEGAATLLGTDLNTEFVRQIRQDQMLRRDLRRALRLAPDDPNAGQDMELPTSTVRQGKFLSFDANGKPTVATVTGSEDTSLRADLADAVTAGKGHNLVAIQRTPAEVTNGVTPKSYEYPPGCLRRYSVSTQWDGTDDAYQAFVDALAANDLVFGYPGDTYKNATGPIAVTGNKTIVGSLGGTHAAQHVTIDHTAATGACFSCTSTEFGGVYIGHLNAVGGNGSFFITNNRPQSIFEYLHMEIYDGGGIELDEATQGAWSCVIRRCKWVPSTTPNAYTGYQISVDGGNILLEHLTAIRGNIGINIDQAENVRIVNPSMNLQNGTYSTESGAAGRRGISLSQAFASPLLYKRAIHISGGYLESCHNNLWIESCESCLVEGVYFDDNAEGGANVAITAADAKNVTLRNNHMRYRKDAGDNIDNAGVNTRVEDSWIDCTGASSPNWLKTATRCEYGNNNIEAGSLDDANGLAYLTAAEESTVTLAVEGSSTPGTYEIASQTSNYTRIGRRVTVDFEITLAGSITGGGSGDLNITGLPFAKKTGTNPVGQVELSGPTFTAAYLTAGFASASVLQINITADNAALAQLGISAVAANDVIRGSISYRI